MNLKPVLEKSCFCCHGAKPKAKAKYFIKDRKRSITGGSSKENAILVVKAGQSPFVYFTADLIEEMEMPPLGRRDRYPKLTKD